MGFRRNYYDRFNELNNRRYSAYDEAKEKEDISPTDLSSPTWRNSVHSPREFRNAFLSLNRQLSQHDDYCTEYLTNIRWPENRIKCPKCQSKDVSEHKKNAHDTLTKRWRCKKCKYSFSYLSNTALANCKTPTWRILLICFMLSNRPDLSYRGLKVVIGKARGNYRKGKSQPDGASTSTYARIYKRVNPLLNKQPARNAFEYNFRQLLNQLLQPK